MIWRGEREWKEGTLIKFRQVIITFEDLGGYMHGTCSAPVVT